MKRLKESFEIHDKYLFSYWREALQKSVHAMNKVNTVHIFARKLIRDIRIKQKADTACVAQWNDIWRKVYLPFDVAVSRIDHFSDYKG